MQLTKMKELDSDEEKSSKKTNENVKKKRANKLELVKKSESESTSGKVQFQFEEVSVEMNKILEVIQGNLGRFSSGSRRRDESKSLVPFKQKLAPTNTKYKSIAPTAQKKSSTIPLQANPRSSSSIKQNVMQRYNPFVKRDDYRLLTSVQKIMHPINDAFKKLKYKVEMAKCDKKTFTVCGNFTSIRKALLARGWIEKIKVLRPSADKDGIGKLIGLPMFDLLEGLKRFKNDALYRRAIMSKMLKDHQVDFYWDVCKDCFRVCPDNVKLTFINRFKTGIFNYTSKQGLCEAMKFAYWFQKPGISIVRYPRAYNLANVENPKDFLYDYKLTACMSLIKYILHHIQTKQVQSIMHFDGKVPIQAFYFAVQELKRALRKFNHEDIDHYIGEAKPQEWNQFLENFNKVVHVGTRLKGDGGIIIKKMQDIAKPVITKIKEYWPSYDIDGMHNIWILKPVNSCRGQGIHLCRTLEYILRIIKISPNKKYIVQKYIEKPLLIYDTKFDIRQWFLISSSNPLTIWIYKDAYIRFSSQIYSLYRLNECVHLTNNSIQSKYRNCTTRSKYLPACNMWDTKQFRNYLCGIGKPNIYDRLIYPGMKQAITAAILINQSALDKRKNCFELYGSDFMITEDFRPWLIEINSHPALGPSTPVTARMCPLVLEDLVKVIIDRSRNPTAPIGRFELLYKEAPCVQPVPITPNLQVQGKKIQKPHAVKKEPPKPVVAKPKPIAQNKVKPTSSGIEEALHSLLNWIQIECNKKTDSTSTTVGINTSESESDIHKIAHLDMINNSLMKPSSKLSKSETLLTNGNKIDEDTNKTIFENVILSMKNLAKAYQEYKKMCKVT